MPPNNHYSKHYDPNQTLTYIIFAFKSLNQHAWRQCRTRSWIYEKNIENKEEQQRIFKNI